MRDEGDVSAYSFSSIAEPRNGEDKVQLQALVRHAASWGVMSVTPSLAFLLLLSGYDVIRRLLMNEKLVL